MSENKQVQEKSEQKDAEIKTEGNKNEKHLTSDIHIRYRGHPSEMIPHHGNLETNMPPGDIHDKQKK